MSRKKNQIKNKTKAKLELERDAVVHNVEKIVVKKTVDEIKLGLVVGRKCAEKLEIPTLESLD